MRTSSPRAIGFTLVELLVVVAILALLLSLLMPSLQRARYVATLAVCASNQRQVALGAMAYTSDHRGKWPARSMPFVQKGLSAPYVLKFTSADPNMSFDDRPMLAPRIPLNLVGQCPFNRRLDFENSTAQQIQTSYSFYFGFQFSTGEQRMERLYDKMTFDGDAFNILVADRTVVYADRPWTLAAHPDYGTGRMQAIVSDNTTWTTAFHRLVGSIERGPLDLNFTRTDGSGFLVSEVEPEDVRLRKVPYEHASASSVSTRWSLLPDVTH